MSYYSHPSSPSCYSATTSSSASTELKLYQAFIFSVPIFFTFILLLLFYLFYLRRRRVDWSSLRMRIQHHNNDISRAELGLKKELREMLPIIIYKESFSVRDTQCSVCLGEYQTEDKLQQIPACGHAFHMDCIDHWLTSHTTCPLCRLSLLAPPKASSELPNIQEETSQASSVSDNSDGTYDHERSRACEEPQTVEYSESRIEDAQDFQSSTPTEQGSSTKCFDQESDVGGARDETEEHEHRRGIPA